MVNKRIIKLCREAIRNDVGTLNDLPHELANTFANIYYKFFELNEKIDNSETGMPSIFAEEGNIFEVLKNFSRESQFILVHIKKIPEYVQGFREIDKIQQPNVYNLLVNLYLDILKYRIKNAHKKIGIWRRMERIFKSNSVNEIPNLIDMINSIELETTNAKNDKLYSSPQDKFKKRRVINNETELNEEGFSALMIAANQGYELAVKYELEHEGTDINLKGKKGLTALMLAVNKGHTNIVKMLINNGANVNETNEDGYTPLMLASNNGLSNIVKILIDEGAYINLKDKDGHTALMLAAKNGHTNIVRMLLQSGADPNIRDKYGFTASVYAAKKRNTQIFQIIKSFS